MGQTVTTASCVRLLAIVLLAGLSFFAGCRSSRAPFSAARAPARDPSGSSAAAGGPSILFASPSAEEIDLDYLKELRTAGFEVDYTEGLGELSPQRIQAFNVLVLFETLDALEVADHGQASDPQRVQSFVAMIEQFLGKGGGVLLMPRETNVRKQRLGDLTDRWGAKLPAEQIVESDPRKTATMPHSAYGTHLAFTDLIAASPVSTGVRGIWYPSDVVYHGAMTGPLVLDAGWQVVVRASATSSTKAIDLTGDVMVPPDLLRRTEPEHQAPLMAVRELLGGRAAIIAEWPQFSVGAGTKWIYDRDVLDRVLSGKGSNFGRLLSNTFRWLAIPSMSRGTLGGFQTTEMRLEGPNRGESVRAQYKATPPTYDVPALSHAAAPAHLKEYRGLIGARTGYSSGRGTVADFARAAREARLDFVVFLEEFSRMTKEKLAALETDCTRNSGSDLLLLPGYSIRSNIGNHLFFFSPHPAWPPDDALTGAGKSILYIQQQDGRGSFTGYRTPFLPWVLNSYHVEKGQVGYYDFADSPGGIPLHDARLYAMVGLRFYRKGRLVEDVLNEYLTTVASTSPPSPASIDEVDSAQELLQEAKSGHSLTYARAASLDSAAPDGLFEGALRWSHQYDAMPISVSSGPEIDAWPACHRVGTYGAEGFSPERAVQLAPLAVVSDAGLVDISIFDGPVLFRRFAPAGAKRFEQTLVLDDAVQRDLVVVAKDRRGGVAVSFPRRSWADGSLAPVFCSDHINDCGPMRLAHGPYWLPLADPPALPTDRAGWTWDGGPPALLASIGIPTTLPELVATGVSASAERLDQVPRLEFADEGAVGVESIRREKYDDRLLQIINPWNTFGPVDGPAPVFENTQRYREWVGPTTGAPAAGWASVGVRTGTNASLFTDSMRLCHDVAITSLVLARLHPLQGAMLVIGGAGSQPTSVSAHAPADFHVVAGQWFAFLGPDPSNAHLFADRGGPLVIHVAAGEIDLLADEKTPELRAGSDYVFELASTAFPVDIPVPTPQRVTAYAEYLREPAGLQVQRGERRPGPGTLDLAANRGAVELALPQAQGVPGLTLPVRVLGLNPRWSAGLLQERGYSPGFYGSGTNRYRGLGVDAEGEAYVPLYPDRASTTRILAGHPVVADAAGSDLFIDVTCLGGEPLRWHISVNNPTDHSVTAMLTQAMDLPDLHFAARSVTLAAGGYLVLQ